MTDIEMMQLGLVTWHTSDADGGWPDVGISVGLGDAMLYAGEAPGLKGGWSLVIYPKDGDRIDIAETVDGETARDLIDKLGLLLSRRAALRTKAKEAGE